MKPVILIGANFVRSQWLFIVIMLAYLLAMAAVIGFHQQRPEVIFYLKLQSSYVIGFGALVTSPAIQTERKSRRILAVLSKGIHRWQYIGGLLCGAVMIVALLCAVMGGAIAYLALHGSMPTTGLGPIILALFLASAASASVALFCSVLLHPLLAMAATALILLLPVVLEPQGVYPPGILFPVYAILHIVNDFRFLAPGSGLWRVIAAAFIQVIAFWAGASLLFAHQDVTAASE